MTTLPGVEVAQPTPAILQVASLAIGAGYLIVAALSAAYIHTRARLLPSWRGVSWKSITFSIIATGACAGALAAASGARHTLLGAGLGALAVVAIGHPVIAAALLATTFILRPWEIAPELSYATFIAKGVVAIAAFSWLFYAARTNRVVIRWNRGIVYFICLVFWIFASIFAWGAPGDSLQKAFESFYPIVGIVFLIMNSVEKRSDIRFISLVLVVAIVTETLASWHLTHATVGFGGSARLQGFYLWGNTNDLASLIVLAIAYTTTVFLTPGWSITVRILATLVLGVLLFSLVWAQSRTSVLALGAMAVAHMIGGTKLSPRSLVLLIVVALIGFGIISSFQRDAGDLEGSSESRLNYVIAGLRMVRAHPIFGVGYGNYPSQYENFTPAFTEFGERTAHSCWVLVGAEAGPAALAFFGALFCWSLARAWRVRKEMPELVLSLTGYGVFMSFLSIAYLFLPYVVMTLASLGPSAKNLTVEGNRSR